MAELSAERFPEFFEALWGYRPFEWQSKLARRVVDDEASPWPQAIALPTAAGKTACIDVAVFALAAGLRRDGPIVRARAPRRLFFVVDRRVIVDEAHERAHELARRLAAAESGVLKVVADALRQIAHGRTEGWQDERPLLAFQLRGGMYRSEAWARSPLQPVVVASTVDQTGSRLLFGAYGRGSGMWPVYAGLLANDSLIFLDEAHCARPFMETLQAVRAYRKLADRPVPTVFYPVVLSATPPDGLSDVLHDTSRERSDPDHPLGRRQLARKPTVLVSPIKGSVKKAVDPFAAALVEHAVDLARDDRKAIVIFVNRVATARAAATLLRKDGHEATLLTGRMRPFDKDDTVRDRLRLLSAKVSELRNIERPVFVVATQTLEVGADLDFDALVSECASLDALRQRFGRLNRRGRAIDARATILIREEQAKSSDDDPVYGAALAQTWAWMHVQAGGAAEIDFGIAQLESRLPDGDQLKALCAPSAHALVMLPAHLDVLAQTSPMPVPRPELSFFLHGPIRAAADVQVCWRADIDLGDDGQAELAVEALTHCPPASTECLPVPLWRMRRWLTGQVGEDQSSDVESENTGEEAADDDARTERRVVRWRGRERDPEVIQDAEALRPGDVIVIPAGTGGWQELGDLAVTEPDIRPVLDWGDRAFRASRARALLRLHPALVATWPVAEAARRSLLALLADSRQKWSEDPETFIADLREQLRVIANETVPERWRWLTEVAGSLAKDRKLSRNLTFYPALCNGVIIKGSRPLLAERELPDSFSDEHDSTASGTVAVPLAEHLPGVAAFARRFADGVGLSQPQVEAIELAGRLHDLGKADPRFQALLRGGQRFVAGELLAKSETLPQGRAAFDRARKLAAYPAGGRHELLSVCIAAAATDVLPSDSTLKALVLHLVASHHGYCRPFAPVVIDAEPVAVAFELLGQTWSHDGPTALERLDSGVADRFWHLTRIYGWWGLAWLEALLRLADHRRSEWEQAYVDE